MFPFRLPQSRKTSSQLPLLSSFSHAAKRRKKIYPIRNISHKRNIGNLIPIDQRMKKICPMRNISHKRNIGNIGPN
jgi:hypothetical protein